MSDIGRPTDYDSSYHPVILIELMSKGLTKAEVYAALNISERTFNRWLEKHQEFKEAYEVGLPKAEVASVWLPLKDMVATKNDKGYKALAHIARNQFGHDKTANTASSNTININSLNVLQTKSDVELMEILNQKLQKLSQYQDVSKIIDIKPDESESK